MKLYNRKHTRLKTYDYSQNGYYFVTICVKNKQNLLGKIELNADIKLTAIERMVEKHIINIKMAYKEVIVDKYVIMPNHIHLIIILNSAVTLHTIVRSLKTMVTKEVGYSIWQISYYEHVIRNAESYKKIWECIDRNPIKWLQDELYNI